MTELKVKNGTFYVLEVNSEDWIFDNERSAIVSLKTIISEGRMHVDPEKVNILEVKIGANWQIKAIPWSKVAIELLKGGDKDV
jgi:hypothetical protein